ncbi:MAG TPA: HD domain-containing phosphohydrolase [Pseudoflavonifractor sp.]|nr:HD domain-containing phosphohydrolase [Pseudoflavonifractor sp.]
MEGLFINGDGSQLSLGLEQAHLTLLAKRQDMEVMVQMLYAHATVWIVPAEDEDTMEFFYVLSGHVDLMLESTPITIPTGGCFHVDGLKREVYLQTNEDTKLLYVTNKPLFDNVFGYQGNLNELMTKVDEKDNYTYSHSHNVMEYSVMLMRRLFPDQQRMDDLINAALFHDVGKCYVPDEILKKPGRLTPGEFRVIMKHPLDSARLLTPKFGKRVAEIARSHHERLDGSGYPFGLSGDDIPLEGRIIAVADSFDAMTTKRVYTAAPRSFSDAAEEIYSLPKLYDQKITALLRALVSSGELAPKENHI